MRLGRSVAVAGILILAAVATAVAWGSDGHRLVSRAAVEGMPEDMPAFFTDAAEQLAWLGPEPDRWRDDDLAVMDEAWKYDHYIDLENVPAGALDARDRFAFLDALYAAGVEDPAQNVGFLPYRILELYQRLVTGFARWREADTEQVRGWVQDRIINDAGILGHYVADAANPHHTTIHYNGWSGDAPNPEGFTTSREFHYQFESRFLASVIDYDQVRAAVPEGVNPVGDARAAIFAYVQRTHDTVETLYQLEQAHGFDPAQPTPQAEAFIVERLAAGASMLRALWYGAWIESAARVEHRDQD